MSEAAAEAVGQGWGMVHKFSYFFDVEPLDNDSTENRSQVLLRLQRSMRRKHYAATVQDVAPQFRDDCKHTVSCGTSTARPPGKRKCWAELPSVSGRQQFPSSRRCDGGMAPTMHARTLLPRNLKEWNERTKV